MTTPRKPPDPCPAADADPSSASVAPCAVKPPCSERRGRGRPSLDQANALTDAILEEALALFRRHGFAATTIDEVAAGCGAAKHTIYRRFASKEDLFSAAVEIERDRLIRSIADIEVSALEPVVALREAARAILRIAVIPGNVELLRMCIAEAHRFPVISAEFDAGRRRIHGALVPFVIRAQSHGAIAPGDPEAIARYIHNAVIGEALLATLLLCPSATETAYWDSAFNATWSMILNGLTPRRPEPAAHDRPQSQAI